jgi:RNA polymerase sigma factor (sigma-70 family)
MANEQDPNDFESVVVPHLDEAYNLARWLMRGASEAEDVVQDAMLRAFTYFRTFKGTNARAWTLKIVRNVAHDALRQRQDPTVTLPLDSDDDDEGLLPTAIADPEASPEALLAKAQDHKLLEALLAELPVVLRECLILHELNGLSYKEIAAITDTPIGTVMSRLWRARRTLIELSAGSDR